MDVVEFTPAYASNTTITNNTTSTTLDDTLIDDRLPVNPLYDKYRYTPIRILRRLTSSARAPRHHSVTSVPCQHCGDTHVHSRKHHSHQPQHPSTDSTDIPLQPQDHCVHPFSPYCENCSSCCQQRQHHHQLTTSDHRSRCSLDRDPMEPFKRDRPNTPLKRLSTFVLKSYRQSGATRPLSHTSSVRCKPHQHHQQLSHTCSVRSTTTTIPLATPHYRCRHAPISKSLSDGINDGAASTGEHPVCQPLPNLDATQTLLPPITPSIGFTQEDITDNIVKVT